MEEKEEIDDMTFDIKLADRVIRIHAIYDYIKEYCRDYVLSKQNEPSPAPASPPTQDSGGKPLATGL